MLIEEQIVELRMLLDRLIEGVTNLEYWGQIEKLNLWTKYHSKELLEEREQTYCAYCGASFPLEPYGDAVNQVTEHIYTCEKHPMRVSEQQLAQAQAEVERLRKELNKAQKIGHYWVQRALECEQALAPAPKPAETCARCGGTKQGRVPRFQPCPDCTGVAKEC